MGTTVTLLQKTTSVVGTAQQVTATETPCSAVIVQPKSTNGIVVYFGDSTVTASTGIRLGIPATTGTPVPLYIQSGSGLNDLNLADMYIIIDSTPAVATGAAGINLLYMVR